MCHGKCFTPSLYRKKNCLLTSGSEFFGIATQLPVFLKKEKMMSKQERIKETVQMLGFVFVGGKK